MTIREVGEMRGVGKVAKAGEEQAMGCVSMARRKDVRVCTVKLSYWRRKPSQGTPSRCTTAVSFNLSVKQYILFGGRVTLWFKAP